MATDVANFRLRFPEFENELEYPDARIAFFLIEVINCHLGTDEARWCGKYDVAQAYLTAHLLTLAYDTAEGDTSANSGPVSAKSVAGVSITKAVVAKSRSDIDDFYSSTAYGHHFLMLRNRCFAPVMVANEL